MRPVSSTPPQPAPDSSSGENIGAGVGGADDQPAADEITRGRTGSAAQKTFQVSEEGTTGGSRATVESIRDRLKTDTKVISSPDAQTPAEKVYASIETVFQSKNRRKLNNFLKQHEELFDQLDEKERKRITEDFIFFKQHALGKYKDCSDSKREQFIAIAMDHIKNESILGGTEAQQSRMLHISLSDRDNVKCSKDLKTLLSKRPKNERDFEKFEDKHIGSIYDRQDIYYVMKDLALGEYKDSPKRVWDAFSEIAVSLMKGGTVFEAKTEEQMKDVFFQTVQFRLDDPKNIYWEKL